MKAPGRANIIGEHTDYNGGTVLPFAIDQSIYFLAKNNDDQRHFIFSAKHKEEEIINADQPEPRFPWSRFFYSAIATLRSQRYDLLPCSIVFDGDLPSGAGLSSSSAITCAFLSVLNHLNHLGLSKLEIVNLASMAENNTGLEGGKMDQMAIMFGSKSVALEINCALLSHQSLEVNLEADWIIIYSKVHHKLIDSDYNNRVYETARAFKKLQEHYPDLHSFSDLREPHLEVLKNNTLDYKRLKHFIKEEARVKKMIPAIVNKNKHQIGTLLYKSHESLAMDYEVSCAELDFIVSETKAIDQVYGARMIGGGFGGSVIALIKKGRLTELQQSLSPSYQNQFNKAPDYFLVKPEDGLSFLS